VVKYPVLEGISCVVKDPVLEGISCVAKDPVLEGISYVIKDGRHDEVGLVLSICVEMRRIRCGGDEVKWYEGG
jgi:hypothetical protein